MLGASDCDMVMKDEGDLRRTGQRIRKRLKEAVNTSPWNLFGAHNVSNLSVDYAMEQSIASGIMIMNGVNGMDGSWVYWKVRWMCIGDLTRLSIAFIRFLFMIVPEVVGIIGHFSEIGVQQQGRRQSP